MSVCLCVNDNVKFSDTVYSTSASQPVKAAPIYGLTRPQSNPFPIPFPIHPSPGDYLLGLLLSTH